MFRAAPEIADYLLARADRSQPANRRYARMDQDQRSPDAAIAIRLANADPAPVGAIVHVVMRG